MNLIDVTRTFQTDDDCLAYMETMRWPDGIRCPVCGCNRISRIHREPGVVKKGKTAGQARKNVRTRIYQCLEPTCKVQFSATSGTIFNDSHLPLTKWFLALALIVDAKKSISAKQLQQHLGIGSYKTAWYMAHRLRKSMENKHAEEFSGIIEMDETYSGGKMRGKGVRAAKAAKQEVIGIKERGGNVRFFHAPDAKIETLAKYLKEHVSGTVEMINTDDFGAYPKALRLAGHDLAKHRTVNHSQGIYVDGLDTTNGIESAFSLFKRALIGSYHKVSIKHLHRYLSEFQNRFNGRKASDRFEPTMRRMLGVEPMPYAELIEAE